MAEVRFNIVADDKGTVKRIEAVSSSLGDLDQKNSNANQSLGALTSSFGRASLQAVGLGAVIGGTAAAASQLVQVVGDSVRAFAAFESSMTRIETLVGLSRSEVAAMVGDVRALSTETGRGPQELSEALFQITSAGQSGSTAIETLRASAQAAAVGLGDVATIADAATSIMNAYGEANVSATLAVDVLLKAVREGKTAPEELAASIGKVVPIAATMGVRIEEVLAAVSSLTRVGNSSAEAVTQVRGALLAILKPTEQAGKALGDVGLSIDDVRSHLDDRGLIETLQFLRKELDDEALARFSGRAEALSGILALTGERIGETRDITDSLNNSLGETEKAMKRVEETSAQRAAKISAHWENVKTTIGEVAVGITFEFGSAIDTASEKIISFAQEVDIALTAFDQMASGSELAAQKLDEAGLGVENILETLPPLASATGDAEDRFEDLAGRGLAVFEKETRKSTAATKEDTKAKEEAAKAAERLAQATERSISALVDRISGDDIQRNAEMVAEAFERIRESGEEITPEGFMLAIETIDDLESAGRKVPPVLREVKEGFDRSKKSAVDSAVAAAQGFELLPEPLGKSKRELVELQSAFEDYEGEVNDATVAAYDLVDALSDVQFILGALISFGGEFGAFIADLVRDMERAGAAGRDFRASLDSKDYVGAAGAGIGGAAAVWNATEGGGKKGAAKGALAGAKFGAAFGPWGAAIGAGVGAIVGALRGRRERALIRDAARDLGAEIPFEMAKAIRESGMDVQLAVAEIFQAGGFESVDRFAEEIGDIFSGLSRGEYSESEAITALEQSVPLLIEHLQELGPEGEAQVSRIIAAAQEMGIEFEGLQELIQARITHETLEEMGLIGETSIQRIREAAAELGVEFEHLLGLVQDTFAPATLEDFMEQFGLTAEEARALADTLGIDIQTNLERLAATLGLSAEEFNALGAALEEQLGIPAEQLAAFLEATGLSAAELAERLGVDVGEGAKTVADEQEKANQRLQTGAELAERIADALGRAAGNAGGINFPNLPGGGGDGGGGGGFPGGTPNMDYLDFGQESRVPLHNREAVIPEAGVGKFATDVARVVASSLGRSGGRGGGPEIHLHIDGGQFLGTPADFLPVLSEAFEKARRLGNITDDHVAGIG